MGGRRMHEGWAKRRNERDVSGLERGLGAERTFGCGGIGGSLWVYDGLATVGSHELGVAAFVSVPAIGWQCACAHAIANLRQSRNTCPGESARLVKRAVVGGDIFGFWIAR